MSELYEKLTKLRDENWRSSRSQQIINVEEYVFKQLIIIAFANKSEPDKLPNTFTIRDVILYQEQFESLMKRIGLDVNIELTRCNYSRGNTYKITKKE